MLQGEILHHVQTPQLLAHVLDGQALDARKETDIKEDSKCVGGGGGGGSSGDGTARSLDGSHPRKEKATR